MLSAYQRLFHGTSTAKGRVARMRSLPVLTDRPPNPGERRPSAEPPLSPQVMRHRREDDAGREEGRRRDDRRPLAVEECLPPPGRDDCGQDERDPPAGARLPNRADVGQAGDREGTIGRGQARERGPAGPDLPLGSNLSRLLRYGFMGVVWTISSWWSAAPCGSNERTPCHGPRGDAISATCLTQRFTRPRRTSPAGCPPGEEWTARAQPCGRRSTPQP